MCFTNIFSQSFHSFNHAFHGVEVLNFNRLNLLAFSLKDLLLVSYLKTHHWTQGHTDFLLCTILKVL